MLNQEIADALDAPYNAAFERGVQDERGAVVAWLRASFAGIEDDKGIALALRRVATIIERGGHRGPEEADTEEKDR
jgi:hypothetical protein